MKAPLNSTDLIKLWSEHRDNIGKDKATYSEGVLFGYLIKNQVPCVWKQEEVKRSSVVSGYIYTKGCSGGTEVGTLSLENNKDIIYCSSCGHRIEIKEKHKLSITGTKRLDSSRRDA